MKNFKVLSIFYKISYNENRGDSMNISFELEEFSFGHKSYESIDTSEHFLMFFYNKNPIFPYYKISLRCVIEYNDIFFSKPYKAYYVEVPKRGFTRSEHSFVYKSWVIETPYLYFSSKQENKMMKKQIKTSLFSFLDHFETTLILPLEEKKKPILSKIWINKQGDNVYQVDFLLKNDGAKYCALVKYQTYMEPGKFVVGGLIKSTDDFYIKNMKPKGVYWRDHVMIQLIDSIRKRSKYRMRHLFHFNTYRFSRTFVPSSYPLDKVKIDYK
jgi:hypothetical protein